MAFEFYNPHGMRLGCTLGQPFGEIKVNPGEYVPTPDMEDKGISSALFEPFVGKSFLHKTPGHVRRRLRLDTDSRFQADKEAKMAVIPQAEVVPNENPRSHTDAGKPQDSSRVETPQEDDSKESVVEGNSGREGKADDQQPSSPPDSGGSSFTPPTPPPAPSYPPTRPSLRELSPSTGTTPAKAIQELADKSCSSGSGKRSRKSGD